MLQYLIIKGMFGSVFEVFIKAFNTQIVRLKKKKNTCLVKRMKVFLKLGLKSLKMAKTHF